MKTLIEVANRYLGEDESVVDRDVFTLAYVEAALWSSMDDNDEPLDKNYSWKDIAPETLKNMEIDCKRFQEENRDLYIKAGWSDEQAGHDFWLSRNGHGAGFFDRVTDTEENSKIGDILQDKAKEYGQVDLYVGDDGKIYN